MASRPDFQPPRVWLAPMSGATDAAFRRQAVRFGAPAVVSEVVASAAFAEQRSDMVRRTYRHEGSGLWIVQLAARRPQDMAAGARLLAQAGVDVIDINMGCPSKQVTGGQSGSALMREPALASDLIAAAIEAAGEIPVTLKMRLGWDDDSLNAPQLAEIAEKQGIRMLTVHGRTRAMFYKGRADWRRIRDTVEATSLPVIANGDIASVADAREALAQSNAHGVMVGRAAMGRPWLAGEIAAAFAGAAFSAPSLEVQCESLCEQISDSVALYGESLGVRTARKHVAAAIDALDLAWDDGRRRAERRKLCQIENPRALIAALRRVYLLPFLAKAA